MRIGTLVIASVLAHPMIVSVSAPVEAATTVRCDQQGAYLDHSLDVAGISYALCSFGYGCGYSGILLDRFPQ